MSHSDAAPDPENLTRKQRRDQAREQRRSKEEAQAAAEARRRRLMQLGGVAAAVVVAIVVIVIATSGSKSPSEPSIPKTSSAKNAAASTVASLLNGVPQSGVTLGKPNAPVTMQYFGDLECPFCKEFTLSSLPSIIQNEVRAGKLKIQYRSLETATREPETFKRQQVAAYAAGKQGKGWYYIELFYHEQGQEATGYATEGYLEGLAKQVPGLNLALWRKDRSDSALETQVFADEKAANRLGFTGTPSFMIGKTGGTPKPLPVTTLAQPSVFESAINKLA